MNNKQFLKLRFLLPIILGVFIGLTLYLMGENDDAPGLVFIGFILAIILIFIGIYNIATKIKKGLILSILCFALGLFGAIFIVVLRFEGDGESPGVFILPALVCIGIIVVGIKLIRNYIKNKDTQKKLK